jgi:diamine N-acetyltransferase
MNQLENNIVHLRALEPDDLDFLFEVENDITFWEVSNTQKPFSKFILQQYLNNSHTDIYEAKQLRLVITRKENQKKIGLVDLFDFDPFHKRLGLGILILEAFQNQGFAFETIQLVKEYAFKFFDLHQIYAHVPLTNNSSLQLFEKSGFIRSGIQKDWLKLDGGFTDVALYQIFNTRP